MLRLLGCLGAVRRLGRLARLAWVLLPVAMPAPGPPTGQPRQVEVVRVEADQGGGGRQDLGRAVIRWSQGGGGPARTSLEEQKEEGNRMQLVAAGHSERHAQRTEFLSAGPAVASSEDRAAPVMSAQSLSVTTPAKALTPAPTNALLARDRVFTLLENQVFFSLS